MTFSLEQGKGTEHSLLSTRTSARIRSAASAASCSAKVASVPGNGARPKEAEGAAVEEGKLEEEEEEKGGGLRDALSEVLRDLSPPTAVPELGNPSAARRLSSAGAAAAVASTTPEEVGPPSSSLSGEGEGVDSPPISGSDFVGAECGPPPATSAEPPSSPVLSPPGGTATVSAVSKS